MTIVTTETLEKRRADIIRRWERATETAKAMRAGEPDEANLGKYVDLYFDTTNTRSLRAIQEDATQNWANWTGATGWATIDFIKLEMERRAFQKIKLLWDAAALPLLRDSFGPRPAILNHLAADLEGVVKGLYAMGHDRQDLKDAFEAAVNGPHEDPVQAVKSARDARLYEMARFARIADACNDAVTAIVRVNESEMAAAWLTARARKRRGYPEKSFVADIKRQGRASASDLKHCKFFLDSGESTVEHHRELGQNVDNRTDYFTPAQMRPC